MCHGSGGLLRDAASTASHFAVTLNLTAHWIIVFKGIVPFYPATGKIDDW
jgi:hypothetical protein